MSVRTALETPSVRERVGREERNHGCCTAGADCGEAFHLMYRFVLSCETQLLVLGTGQPYTMPPREICEKTAAQYRRPGGGWASTGRRR